MVTSGPLGFLDQGSGESREPPDAPRASAHRVASAARSHDRSALTYFYYFGDTRNITPQLAEPALSLDHESKHTRSACCLGKWFVLGDQFGSTRDREALLNQPQRLGAVLLNSEAGVLRFFFGVGKELLCLPLVDGLDDAQVGPLWALVARKRPPRDNSKPGQQER